MADFTLTVSATDNLVGAADVADVFLVNVGAHLAGSDTVSGGAGNTTSDRLVLGGAMTLTAAAFAHVSGIERLVFNAGGGSTVTLADLMVATTSVGSFTITGGAGADVLLGGAVTTTALRASGGGGNDRFVGGGGNDRFAGGVGADTLIGGAGNDTLSGGLGNDRLEAGTGEDRLDGGAGNDLYVFASGGFTLGDLVADESGVNDTLQFSGAAAVAFTSSPAARVAGIERILFGSGNDVFTPGSSFGDGVESDVITVLGGGGDDRLDASAVRSLLPLGFLLSGGAGADTLVGGRGNDTLDAGDGLGPMDGGAGNDVLIVQAAGLTGAVAITGGDNGGSPAGGDGDVLRLVGSAPVGAAQLAGITGIEIVELDATGGDIVVTDALAAGVSSVSFDLTVRGSAADDSVDTSALASGRDIVIDAGDGDDTVIGGAGDDTVRAGAGADTFQLGTGTDRVIFAAGQLSGADVVAADAGVAGDVLEVGLSVGRTLAASAFAGVSGFDSFQLVAGDIGTTVAARLPTTLVTQSGLGTVTVGVIGAGDSIVDGRAVGGTWTLNGGSGSDILFGGSGVNTLSGGAGIDTIVGGDGGDLISLGVGGTERDVALITSIFDGTIDIDGTLSAGSLAGADQVTGLSYEGNFIGVDPTALGLPSSSTLYNSAGGNIAFGWGAIVLPTVEEIAGNAFGSLTAVRDAVGARFTGNVVGVDEKIILVIGGEDETQFGVYYFEDRDDNATVDAADLLMLLAIGNTDVPAFGGGRGFTLTSLDVL